MVKQLKQDTYEPIDYDALQDAGGTVSEDEIEITPGKYAITATKIVAYTAIVVIAGILLVWMLLLYFWT